MLATAHDALPFIPVTPEERDAVRAQLERMLLSPHFRNSKRYPLLLRFVVEEPLEGRGPALKERTVGTEVFGRRADYDTATDPIVRVTVAEVRKRIAQYYHENAHAYEFRIELTPGRYTPEFFYHRENGEHSVTAGDPVDAEVLAETETVHTTSPETPLAVQAAPRQRHRNQAPRWIALTACLLLAAAAWASWRYLHPSPMDQLWAPVLAKDGPITYCLPLSVKKNSPGKADTTEEAIAHALDVSPFEPAGSQSSFIDHELLYENVVYSDVLAMMRLGSMLEPRHLPDRVRTNLSTKLSDLREGPVILIGGLSNQWTLQEISNMRYRFGGSAADGYYIRDSQDPANRQWSVYMQHKWVAVDRDYAIVARVHSKIIGSTVMVAAGVGMSGTAAAGEFLSDPAQVAELRRRLGPALRDRDFEVVLRTNVVDGIAGSPEILAATLL